MNEYLSQHYRCPSRYISLELEGPLEGSDGYFRFGGDAVCYGRYHGRRPSDSPAGVLYDALLDTTTRKGTVYLPFDLTAVIDNLRLERYVADSYDQLASSLRVKMYYLIRSALPFSVRSYLKKLHLKGWETVAFPRWPVDCSVDNLFERLLLLSLEATGAEQIPFIWFWPDGASACAIMTHDVETQSGQRFCPTVMDIDDSFGIKASLQIIPEQRYGVDREFLDSVHRRGFEVVVHDLNHDGHLYRDREEFVRRAEKINSYRADYGAEGFRAAILYRKQLWFDALRFSYDMSVPNVAHLDPQRGGCCTVMPFFIGKILELPVTTTQDYTLFHILDDYSIELWKRQTDLIMAKHGLMSFIVHPDYLAKARERGIYEALLGYLARLRDEKDVWITIPGEVNRWWRQRAEMKILENGKSLRIEGVGSERARIAFASKKDGRLVFTYQVATEQALNPSAVQGPNKRATASS